MKEYFSHDFNARNDTKLTKVFMKHGVSGIGIYWCIIEMLYEESGYLDISEYERIAFELRVNIETIKSIIEDFNLFENDGEKFWSNSAISRLKQRMEKSQKARESVMKRWEKYERNTDVKGTKNDSNTSKVKESKVKESNEDKKKFNFKSELLNLGVNENIASDWLEVRSKKKAANTETAFNGLKTQIEKSGLSANECIKISAERSWQGFNHKWLDNEKNRSNNRNGFKSDTTRKTIESFEARVNQKG